jgi:NTP pyrophosphatase (non-canonical NTP hydrolase)
VTRDEVFELISAERERQDEKWGSQDNRHERWLTILTEEVGEAAEAILDLGDPHTFVSLAGYFEALQHLQDEVVQIAAVAVSWLEQQRWSLADYPSVEEAA